jgi:hypothetical protein
MTVCYRFVSRREIQDFTPADHAALSNILGPRRSSAAAEHVPIGI